MCKKSQKRRGKCYIKHFGLSLTPAINQTEVSYGLCGPAVFSPPVTRAKLSTDLRHGFRNGAQGGGKQEVKEVDH